MGLNAGNHFHHHENGGSGQRPAKDTTRSLPMTVTVTVLMHADPSFQFTRRNRKRTRYPELTRRSRSRGLGAICKQQLPFGSLYLERAPLHLRCRMLTRLLAYPDERKRVPSRAAIESD